MVFQGVEEGGGGEEGAVSEQAEGEADKPQALHNFSMPLLKWGNQKMLRCMRVNHGRDLSHLHRSSDPEEFNNTSHSEPSKKSPPIDSRKNSKPFSSSSSSSSSAPKSPEARTNLKKKVQFSEQTEEMKEKKQKKGPDEEESTRPWNLRTRKSVCKISKESGGGERLRSRISDSSNGSIKKERVKFSVSLTREEIEEDIFGLTGSKPSRRPKKRAKIIQRILDVGFPGLWLSEITLDSYKVSEFHDSRKR